MCYLIVTLLSRQQDRRSDCVSVSSLSVNRQIFWNSNSVDNCILGLLKHYSGRRINHSTNPNCYRLISLLSTLGKLFKPIIAVRLTSLSINIISFPMPNLDSGKSIRQSPNWLESQITSLQSPQTFWHDPTRY
jgi:hypothetical protein